MIVFDELSSNYLQRPSSSLLTLNIGGLTATDGNPENKIYKTFIRAKNKKADSNVEM